MPIILLDLPDDLLALLDAYAARYGSQRSESAQRLLRSAFAHWRASQRGARATADRQTPAERSAAARHAAMRRHHPEDIA